MRQRFAFGAVTEHGRRLFVFRRVPVAPLFIDQHRIAPAVRAWPLPVVNR